MMKTPKPPQVARMNPSEFQTNPDVVKLALD